MKTEYKNCFICGIENKVGLKLDFYYKGHKAYANWIADKNYEGFEETIHGGIIASLIDEAVAKIIIENGFLAVTVELNVKYLKPLKVGTEIVISGEIIDHRRKLINGKAIIYNKNDNNLIYATGNAKYYVIDGD